MWLIAVTAITLRAQPNSYQGFNTNDGYIANRGQWNKEAVFLAQDGNLNLWVTDNGFVYDLRSSTSPRTSSRGVAGPRMAGGRTGPSAERPSGHVVRVTFEGSDPSDSARGVTLAPSYRNYMIGSDRNRWAARVPV
jgi:hypothetical protein